MLTLCLLIDEMMSLLWRCLPSKSPTTCDYGLPPESMGDARGSPTSAMFVLELPRHAA